MGKKQKPDNRGIVYSTDPSFKPDEDHSAEQTLAPSAQKLKISLDKRHRAGKAVTLIEGFVGSEAALQELGKSLKTFCGTGGSAKDMEIIVQGDQRDKVLQWLMKNGYNKSRII